MLNLADMSLPTQSNGKVDFLDLSVMKQKAVRRALEKFQLKYVKEVKEFTPDKHNFVLDKTYFEGQTVESFWVVGKNIIEGKPRAFMIQSLDGEYGKGKNIMRVWRAIGCSTKITSSAIHTVLSECGLINDTTVELNFNLELNITNLANCRVFEILSVSEEVEVASIDIVEEEVVANEVEDVTAEEVTNREVEAAYAQEQAEIAIEIAEYTGNSQGVGQGVEVLA